jgi:hypothetical protein
MQKRGLIVGAAIGAAVASAAGVAYAAIPTSGGELVACWKKATTATKPVQLLDTAQSVTCPKGWNRIAWSQAGAAGAAVVERFRLSSVDGGGNVTFTKSTWDQPADADQELIPGSITLTAPTSCTAADGSHRAGVPVSAQIQIDDRTAFLLPTPITVPLGQTRRLRLSTAGLTGSPFPPALTLEPPGGSTIAHHGAAGFVSTNGSCTLAGEDITVTGLGFDVVEAR